jgi:hypothetical protein
MGMWRERRRGVMAAAVGVTVALGGLGAAGQSAAAPRNSIKIVLPRHIKVGKPATIRLTGFASRKYQIALLSDRGRCRRSFTAEGNLGNVGIWVDGNFVHGHYRFAKFVAYPESTHGRTYFCAYLIQNNLNGTSRTIARGSLRFRIPS